jgi:hypothetical protein
MTTRSVFTEFDPRVHGSSSQATRRSKKRPKKGIKTLILFTSFLLQKIKFCFYANRQFYIKIDTIKI